MLYLLVALGYSACAPRLGKLPQAALLAKDGDILESDAPVGLVALGHAERSNAALDEIRAMRPAGILLTSDLVEKHRARSWRALMKRIDGLPVLPMAGPPERSHDRRLRVFHHVFDGLGVRGTTTPSTWYAVDVHVGQTRWRMVVLDSDRSMPAERWLDQRFWVPKVVGDDGYDQLIVALWGGPGRLDGSRPEPTLGASELLELVRRHADASRLALVASGGPLVPAIALPGGQWGEAWLTTGAGAGPVGELRWGRRGLRPAPGLVEALIGEDVGGPNRDQNLTSIPGAAGVWVLTLEEAQLRVTLRRPEPGGMVAAYELVWSPERGWAQVRR